MATTMVVSRITSQASRRGHIKARDQSQKTIKEQYRCRHLLGHEDIWIRKSMHAPEYNAVDAYITMPSIFVMMTMWMNVELSSVIDNAQ